MLLDTYIAENIRLTRQKRALARLCWHFCSTRFDKTKISDKGLIIQRFAKAILNSPTLPRTSTSLRSNAFAWSPALSPLLPPLPRLHLAPISRFSISPHWMSTPLSSTITPRAALYARNDHGRRAAYIQITHNPSAACLKAHILPAFSLRTTTFRAHNRTTIRSRTPTLLVSKLIVWYVMPIQCCKGQFKWCWGK